MPCATTAELRFPARLQLLGLVFGIGGHWPQPIPNSNTLPTNPRGGKPVSGLGFPGALGFAPGCMLKTFEPKAGHTPTAPANPPPQCCPRTPEKQQAIRNNAQAAPPLPPAHDAKWLQVGNANELQCPAAHLPLPLPLLPLPLLPLPLSLLPLPLLPLPLSLGNGIRTPVQTI